MKIFVKSKFFEFEFFQNFKLLGTLDCIGKFIREATDLPGENWSRRIWRIDGSSGSLEREKIINEFTAFGEPAILLISTRAGCVGINVIAATRVDAVFL